jgi:hypothetical protein
MPITYNTAAKRNFTHIYTTTGGGTIFSANLTASTNLDLFSDTAVVNDAIYFGMNAGADFSDLYVNVGTAMVGVNIVLAWEYYTGVPDVAAGRLFLPNPADWTTAKWRPIEDLVDNTNGFTIIGANTIQFPIQMFPANIAVNGVTALWIRCRIVGLTSISEGGANQTTRIQTNNGFVNITDYTESVPCTFLEVYDWLRANQPHIGVQKGGMSFFDFKKTPLNINSPLLTMRETIEIGNWNLAGGNRSPVNSFAFIRSGFKSGEDSGIDGSNIILYSQSNNSIISFSASSKCYGTRILSRGGMTTASGYPAPSGEFIDCVLEGNFAPSGGLTGINNKWVNYGIYILGGFWNPAIFRGNKFILTTNNLGYFYGGGWDAKELTWSYRASVAGFLFFKNQT